MTTPTIPVSASDELARFVEVRRAIHVAVLQAAATFAAGRALNHDISSADVLKVAEAFERWVSQES